MAQKPPLHEHVQHACGELAAHGSAFQDQVGGGHGMIRLPDGFLQGKQGGGSLALLLVLGGLRLLKGLISFGGADGLGEVRAFADLGMFRGLLLVVALAEKQAHGISFWAVVFLLATV